MPIRPYTPQEVWGGLIGAYFVLNALGTGSYISTFYSQLYLRDKQSLLVKIGAIASPCLLILAMIFLMLDLGLPEHAMNVFLRPLTSVTSLGATLLLATVTITGIQALGFLFKSHKLAYNQVLWLLGFILTVMVAWYPGALLWEKAGIPFWNTPLMPFLFLFTAICAGAGLLMCVYAVLPSHRRTDAELTFISRCSKLAWGSLLLSLILLLGHLGVAAVGPSPTARFSVTYLTTGPFGAAFLVVGLLMGLVIPLILIYSFILRQKAPPHRWAGVTGLLVIVGISFLRYMLLAAGCFG